MTLVVGFNFGEYALIGADTRVSWYINDALRYRDDELKICRTQLGIISGAGLCQLLDPVKRELDEKEDLAHTDEILSMVRRSREDFESYYQWKDKRVLEALDTTAWMFTYAAKTTDGIALRLAVLSSKTDDRIGLLPVNSGGLIPPTGVSDDQLESWQTFLTNNLQPYEPGVSDLNKHATHHAVIVRLLMEEVAKVNDGVSDKFQVGIHCLPMNVGISGIFAAPDYNPDWQWERD